MALDLTSILSGLAIFLVGALVNHTWNRYRTRLHRVRWSAQYVRVAIAGEDPRLGRVEVLYNGASVKNVHTCVLQLENESNADLDDLVLNLACVEGSTIYMAYGFLEGGLKYLPFTDEYWEELRKEDADADVLNRRDFRIPVFNRGAKANITLLLSREDQAQPIVTVSCVHKGVQLREKPPTQTLWGVSHTHALLIGWAVTAAVVTGLILAVESRWTMGLGSWFAGLMVIAVGAVVVRLWRWLGRVLS